MFGDTEGRLNTCIRQQSFKHRTQMCGHRSLWWKPVVSVLVVSFFFHRALLLVVVFCWDPTWTIKLFYAKGWCGGVRRILQRGMWKLWGVINMLFWLWWWCHGYIHMLKLQIVYLEYVQCILCQLYLNKAEENIQFSSYPLGELDFRPPRLPIFNSIFSLRAPSFFIEE